jgi:class 3 adenylate cyclase
MTCSQCGAQSPGGHRFCPLCGTPLSQAAERRVARKTVSFLFIDLADSTVLGEKLDPEPLHQILQQYFAACSMAIAEHGGAVEKYVGDAVMAAFGAHIAREDDALRAIRAAADALATIATLSAELAVTRQVNLQARCGICTGEVMVTTDQSGDFRVVGDAVNTAARLQSAAPPGGILIGAETASMVRGRVGLEAVPPLRLKGKAEAVPAWRVTDAAPGDAGAAVPAAPFIGREDELADLRQGLRRALRHRQVYLATVLGAPGMGKSRLVQEFLAALRADGDGGPVTVLSGRCSSYGRGVTYQPLADLLGSYDGGWEGLTTAFLAGPGPGRRAAASLASIGGLELPDLDLEGQDPAAAEAAMGTAGTGDIAWAVRHVLEAAGRAQPVIMVWEDLHWAEETLLDLIDDIATWLQDVPVLMLCVARPDLLEQRPSWGGGKPNAMTVELAPLTYEQSTALVSELAMAGEVQAHASSEALVREVATQCDGNPLFAELMLDVVGGTGPGTRIPPTINALLGARLDQLPDEERGLLERAAVIGRDIDQGLLQAMAEAEGTGTGGTGTGGAGTGGTGAAGTGAAAAEQLIGRLVRRRLLRWAGPASLQFTQTLLRDTAYSHTPKVRRERWHAFLAVRLSEVPAGSADGDALAFARHAEAACLLRRELHPGDQSLAVMASAAADALVAAGRQALGRGDLPAAAAMLERGRDLLPPGDVRHAPLALHICDSWLGQWDGPRALAALSAAEAALTGDRTAAIAVQRSIVSLRLGLASAEVVATDAARAGDGLAGTPEDHLGWCRWQQLQAYLHLARDQAAAAEESFRQALERAQAIADQYEEDRIQCALCEIARWAPTSVGDGLALCEALAVRFAVNRALLIPVLVTQAYLAALAGDLGAAGAVLEAARAQADDVHLDDLAEAVVIEMSALTASLSGAHDRAGDLYRQEEVMLAANGQALAARIAGTDVVRELLAQDRVAAAAAALGAVGPVDGAGGADGEEASPRLRIAVTALRARVAVATGDTGLAVTLARQAGALAAGTDDPYLAGEILFDQAIVLRAAGLADEATAAGNLALARFEAKGAALPAGRVRAWLAVTGEDQPELAGSSG